MEFAAKVRTTFIVLIQWLAHTRHVVTAFHEQQARQTTTVPLMVTGGFRSVAAMEEAIRSRAVDIIGMARPLTVQV